MTTFPPEDQGTNNPQGNMPDQNGLTNPTPSGEPTGQYPSAAPTSQPQPGFSSQPQPGFSGQPTQPAPAGQYAQGVPLTAYPQAAKKSKTGLIVGLAVILVVIVIALGGLMIAPGLAAKSWRKDAKSAVNASALSLKSNKPQVQKIKIVDLFDEDTSDSQYDSTLEAFPKDIGSVERSVDVRINNIRAAKQDFPELGGLSFIDVAGKYGDAEKLRTEIVAAYDAAEKTEQDFKHSLKYMRLLVTTMDEVNNSNEDIPEDGTDEQFLVAFNKSADNLGVSYTKLSGEVDKDTKAPKFIKDFTAIMKKVLDSYKDVQSALKSGNEAAAESAFMALVDVLEESDTKSITTDRDKLITDYETAINNLDNKLASLEAKLK